MRIEAGEYLSRGLSEINAGMKKQIIKVPKPFKKFITPPPD